MQLGLFRSYPSVVAVPLIDYLAMDCILQANEIQHDLLDLRLAIMMEKDLSSLIHPHNITWPGYYVHLVLLWCLSCPLFYWSSWLWPTQPTSFSFPTWITKSLWICRHCDRAWDLSHPPSPTVPANHPLSSIRLNHSTSGASCTKEQEELRKVFSVLEGEGITEVLAPLIIHKKTEWYKPYRVYCHQQPSPTSIPLPDSPPTHSPIPSRPPTPSPKSPLTSPKPLLSYHMAPSHQPDIICCEGCDKEGHILVNCTHNYLWHPDTETYTLIPYREKTTVPCSGWTLVLVLGKTGESLA